jgi:peptidoglycan hydrolase-like protein with peptidoglycan-binding domain
MRKEPEMSVRARLVSLGSTVLAVPLIAVGVASPALAATPPPPKPSKTLPADLDVQTPYEAQVSCDPRDKPGVIAFSALMKATYNPWLASARYTWAAGTFRTCLSDTSEHYDGRALDWMLSVNDPAQKAVAQSVVDWLSANNGVMARRFGISYIIWNHQMWREYRPQLGWAHYTGAVPHTDHVHFSFSWDGAMKRTSWWTGKANTVVDLGPCRVYAGQFAPLYTVPRTAACPTSLPVAPLSPYPVYVIGQKNAQIGVAQQALGLTPDGTFGSRTYSTLIAWQTRVHVPITGVLDKATWARLVPTPGVVVAAPPKQAPAPAPAPAPKPVAAPSRSVAQPPATPRAVTPYSAYKSVVLRQGSKGSAVVALQHALHVTSDGDFGPKTRSALVTFQTLQRISPNGVADRLVWDRLEQRDYPLVAYSGLSLKQGSKGVAVVALQRALGVTPDGAFGAKTMAGVQLAQLRANLAPTGVVSGATWQAIEKQIR